MLDVAVIGAGPAGLTAAAALLQCRSKPLRVQVSILPLVLRIAVMSLELLRQC